MSLAKKFLLAGAVTFGIYFIYTIVDRSLFVYVEEASPSRFAQTYNPDRVVNRYKSDPRGPIGGAGSELEAGRHFVTENKLWRRHFFIHPGDQSRLMDAVREDLLASLTNSGAHIIHEPGAPILSPASAGFEVRYYTQHINGIVVVQPPSPWDARTEGLHSTPVGDNAVELKVQINERWFRSERQAQAGGWPDARQVSSL